MSETGWDEYQEEPPQGPKALRDLYEKQRNEMQALTEEISNLRKANREAQLSRAFSEANLPPKASAFFPSDLEPTEDNITKWVTDYGDLFGKGAAAPAENTEAPAEAAPQAQAPAPVVPQEVQAQISAMGSIAQAPTPVTAPLDDLKRVLANPRALDEVPFDRFQELMRKAGAKV